jgi:hypothetical protein
MYFIPESAITITIVWPEWRSRRRCSAATRQATFPEAVSCHGRGEPPGVEVLELGEDAAGEPARDAPELDERRVADRGEDRCSCFRS